MRRAKTDTSRAVARRGLWVALAISLLVAPLHGWSADAGEASQVTEIRAVALEAGMRIEIHGDGSFYQVEDFVIEDFGIEVSGDSSHLLHKET